MGFSNALGVIATRVVCPPRLQSQHASSNLGNVYLKALVDRGTLPWVFFGGLETEDLDKCMKAALRPLSHLLVSSPSPIRWAANISMEGMADGPQGRQGCFRFTTDRIMWRLSYERRSVRTRLEGSRR